LVLWSTKYVASDAAVFTASDAQPAGVATS